MFRHALKRHNCFKKKMMMMIMTTMMTEYIITLSISPSIPVIFQILISRWVRLVEKDKKNGE